MRELPSEELSPILDDQPSPTDFLDFKSYVQALKELIVHNKTQTPLTLGIFGRWGMGKTTLMKMLEEDLDKEGTTTIWFNAWQYSDEDELWAAFLQSMLNKIEHSLGALQLPIFKFRLFLKRIQWNEIPQSLLVYFLRILVAILPVLLIDPVSQQFAPEAMPIVNLGGKLATFALAVWIVGKPIIDAIRKNVSIDISNFQKKSNYQEHIAFLDRFRDHFSDIVQCLPKKADKRLAVFIDDLDRCSPESTIQVLDAIKLFVDVKGCVYILGLDVDVVQRAVATKYRDDPLAQREYMSKIIQIPFQLPPLTRNEMRIFLEQLTLDLPDPNCHKVFITGLVVNPREVKRTINIFSLLWNLAAKRKELEGRITPVRLAKVVVIQQGFPELHRIFQQRPSLLIELERYFQNEEKDKLAASISPEVKESNDEEKSPQLLKPKNNLPPEVLAFVNNESLRSMLLLFHSPGIAEENTSVNSDYNFTDLNVNEVAIYFTLAGRTEAPKPDNSSLQEDANLVGQVVGGRYQIRFELGRGGMSTVYLAYDQRLQRDVALKILPVSLVKAPSFIQRFDREIRTLARLSHPNLVALFDNGIVKGCPYYTMEYLSGGNLQNRLDRKSLSDVEFVSILVLILDAMNYIHDAGIVHRDIKPSSILFNHKEKPFLTDFGISTGMPNELSLTGDVIMGTPAYMSPEQCMGNTKDTRSDLYSFGVLMFEFFAGKKPYEADSPMPIMMKHISDPVPSPMDFKPEISLELDKLIMKLLAKNPNDRYQTALEVKAALIKIYPEAGNVSPQTEELNITSNPTNVQLKR